MQAMTAENAVIKSRPENSSSMVITMMLEPYSAMKASTENKTLLGMTWSPSLTGITAFGCSIRLSSRQPCSSSNWVRIILMPPPVEPALEAVAHSSSISMGANIGQVL